MSSHERKITRREFLQGIIITPTWFFIEKNSNLQNYLYKPSESLLNNSEISEPSEEEKIEQKIEQAYRECFRTYEINGQTLNLRVPFALYKERKGHSVYTWGKGNISQVWEETEKWLNEPYFHQYLEALQEPKEKVVHFNLPLKKFFVYTDLKLIAKMKEIYSLREEFNKTGKWRLVDKIANLYPGNDTQVYLLKKGGGFNEKDVYDFLYCIGGIGIDCARFTYHCQQKIYGNELNIKLGKELRVSPQNVHLYIGSWFYYPPECSLVEKVEDKISNLKAGDVIHFHGQKSSHSVIIQSIDLNNGVIRYLQCTDWGLQEERGVHQSLIFFKNPEQRLRDKDVTWTQQLGPTFPGETAPYGWKTDGDRYLGTKSMVVRLKPFITSGLLKNTS